MLLGHDDEVWHLEWNHKGDALASCGKDGWLIIWSFGPTTDSEDEGLSSVKTRTNGNESNDADTEMENGSSSQQNGNGRIQEEEEVDQEMTANGNGASQDQASSSNLKSNLHSPSSIPEAKLRKKLGPHSGSITWLAWSPDDEHILATSDTEILLWDVQKGTNKTFGGHSYTVGTVAWMPNGKSFVTGGMDGKINIWVRFHFSPSPT